MLSLPASVRIYLATDPVDMRKGFDGLSALVAAQQGSVFGGDIFVFVSRRGDRLKLLTWDRGGFVLFYKRLERGRFRLPAFAPSQRTVALDATSLAMLLDGIDIKRVLRPRHWQPPRTLGIDSRARS